MNDPSKPTYAQVAWKGKEILQEDKEKLSISIDLVSKAVIKAQKTGERIDGDTTRQLKRLRDELSWFFVIQRKKHKKMLLNWQDWTSEMRISFYCEVNNRAEDPNDPTNSGEYTTLWRKLNKIEVSTIGKGKGNENTLLQEWRERIDTKLLNKMTERDNYDFKSVRHLVRFIRNLNNHHRNLPLDIQRSVRPYEEMDKYFTKEFPGLLAAVCEAVSDTCKEKDCFGRYFD